MCLADADQLAGPAGLLCLLQLRPEFEKIEVPSLGLVRPRSGILQTGQRACAAAPLPRWIHVIGFDRLRRPSLFGRRRP
jgi:hypothetical protein